MECLSAKGSSATIYKPRNIANPQHIFKFPHPTEYGTDNFELEHQLFIDFKREARGKSANFAKYLVDTKVTLITAKSKTFHGFVKQYVKGPTLGEIGPLNINNANHQKIIAQLKELYQALRDAIAEGHNISDISNENIIWSSSEERLWVIDGHLDPITSPGFEPLLAFEERCAIDWAWCKLVHDNRKRLKISDLSCPGLHLRACRNPVRSENVKSNSIEIGEVSAREIYEDIGASMIGKDSQSASRAVRGRIQKEVEEFTVWLRSRSEITSKILKVTGGLFVAKMLADAITDDIVNHRYTIQRGQVEWHNLKDSKVIALIEELAAAEIGSEIGLIIGETLLPGIGGFIGGLVGGFAGWELGERYHDWVVKELTKGTIVQPKPFIRPSFKTPYRPGPAITTE